MNIDVANKSVRLWIARSLTHPHFVSWCHDQEASRKLARIGTIDLAEKESSEVQMKFSDRTIDKLKPGAKRRLMLEDNSHGHGSLGVRVSPNGRKTFVHVFRVRGKQRMVTLGTYPTMTLGAARAAMAATATQLEVGVDPVLEVVEERARRKLAPTVEALADEYIERWAKVRKRTWREDERVLRRDVVPVLGHMKAEDVKRKHIHLVLDPVTDRGSLVMANRVLACVRKMFNWAESRGVIEHSPCNRIDKPAKETARERVLDVVELETFLCQLPEQPVTPTVRRALLFSLLTAQRSGEVVSMRWADLDASWTWWTIPGERAKNGRSHRVPLTPAAVRLLRAARADAAGSDFVFPATSGKTPIRQTSLARALARNHEAMGLAKFGAHDLRRTAATHMTSGGVQRLVVSKLLNHTDDSVTARYDLNSYDKEKRAAVELWEAQLLSFGFEGDSSVADSSGRGDASTLGASVRRGGRRRVRRKGRRAAMPSQQVSELQPVRGAVARRPTR